MVSASPTPHYLVTLVHGTWAQDASWTKENSKLRVQLANNLNAPVEFRNFDWSGKNSHQARNVAAKNLAQKLKSQHVEQPESRHVVIAHSHGGNIAMYASRYIEDGQFPKVVCLATPFFVQYDDNCFSKTLRYSLYIALYFIFQLFIWAMLGSFNLNRLDFFEFEQIISIPFVFFVTLFLIKYINYRATSVLGMIWIREWVVKNILSIYFKGDEANRYLVIVNWSTNIGKISLLVSIFSLITGFFLALSSIVYAQNFLPQVARSVGYYTDLSFQVFSVAAVLTVCSLFSRCHPLAYGWEWPSAGLVQRVSVSSHPNRLPAKKVVELRMDYKNVEQSGGLRHSAIYKSEAVIVEIASWLERSFLSASEESQC